MFTDDQKTYEIKKLSNKIFDVFFPYHITANNNYIDDVVNRNVRIYRSKQIQFSSITNYIAAMYI